MKSDTLASHSKGTTASREYRKSTMFDDVQLSIVFLLYSVIAAYQHSHNKLNSNHLHLGLHNVKNWIEENWKDEKGCGGNTGV